MFLTPLMAVFNLASNGDMGPDGLTTNNYDISVMCVQLVCVEIGRVRVLCTVQSVSTFALHCPIKPRSGRGTVQSVSTAALHCPISLLRPGALFNQYPPHHCTGTRSKAGASLYTRKRLCLYRINVPCLAQEHCLLLVGTIYSEALPNLGQCPIWGNAQTLSSMRCGTLNVGLSFMTSFVQYRFHGGDSHHMAFRP
jgi:hypothetical protein